MHISEGVLRPEILISSAVVATALVGYLAWRIELKSVAKTAAMSALFFVASFIHMPLGPTSIHLILGGLIGAILGLEAVLAIFVGLVLQAVLFGYGGLAVLGTNLLLIAAPATLGRVFLLLSNKQIFSGLKQQIWQKGCWFLIGFVPILLSALLLAFILILNGSEFTAIAWLSLAANAPLMAIEGFITLVAIGAINRLNKEILR